MEDTCGFKSRRIFSPFILMVIVILASAGIPSLCTCSVMVRSARAALPKAAANSAIANRLRRVIGKGRPGKGS